MRVRRRKEVNRHTHQVGEIINIRGNDYEIRNFWGISDGLGVSLEYFKARREEGIVAQYMLDSSEGTFSIYELENGNFKGFKCLATKH